MFDIPPIRNNNDDRLAPGQDLLNKSLDDFGGPRSGFAIPICGHPGAWNNDTSRARLTNIRQNVDRETRYDGRVKGLGCRHGLTFKPHLFLPDIALRDGKAKNVCCRARLAIGDRTGELPEFGGEKRDLRHPFRTLRKPTLVTALGDNLHNKTGCSPVS